MPAVAQSGPVGSDAALVPGVAETLAPPVETPEVVAPPKRHRFRPHIRPVHIHVRVRTFDSLRYRNFRLLWGSTTASSGANWLQQVVLGWLTYQLTQSAFWTSMVLGLEALPILLAGPVGGLLVDRWNRKKLLSLVYAYQAILSLGLSILVIFGEPDVWHIFLFVLLLGMSWVITDPARMSLIANIIPRANLLNAFSLNAMAFSVTRLTIPALGGVLLALVGAGPSILFMVGLQLAAFTMVLGLRLEPSVRPKLRLTAAFSELLEGARYVKNNRTLLGLFLLGFIPSVLVTPFVHGLMPVFAAEVFDVGPRGLGLLLSAIGAGATIGTVVLASLGEVKRKGRTIITAVAVMGLAMAVFTQLPTYWVALLALLVLSAGMSVFFATTSASVQGILTDDLRGRVSGLFMVTWGVLPAGSMLAGVLADSLGAPSAALIAAGITGVVLTALVLRFRPLWSFD